MSERSERASRPDKPIARARLETPVESRFRFEIDPEAVARGSETVARFLGTGRYLLLQTVVVVVWIGLNVFAVSLQWDPYPFILLNLAFSTQAAYAAPLILLAQNRQDNRDKVSLEEDRRRAAQTKADTEFLARELAALRIAVGEVATRDYLRRELEDIKDALARLQLHAPLDDEDAVETAKSKKSTDRKRGRVPISPQIDGG
ncbi:MULTISPECIES: DUF1003 domain-containing protein [Nocardia]|jgi:uncharacterized membrane protein|uniref:DUF1003 domain-containing protein n=1 Tax=Nocardia nova TaxID=37330 RepID=A0A2S5ZZV5_9NOCA|nr:MULTISPECIES: DUF1003 domain-containing protein [Nocardia]OBF78985.1 hypothetical protein A9X06_22000 [Mycobacterium sp. 852002-51759_SCH5129042]MBF6275452.1 DUF1003 domain-containing protein [Nocardia nova]MBV7704842.1 DUF1003 domain-containing protein [Nocardia nova]OBA52638.1 hypothetical protein A5789_25445 [Nocardia sp. 852002-51101_SCH5132738]OBB52462.1 hypothetical protein A5748_15300 [Nocardia sp. 852002-51244_SCH5132740]